MGINMHLLGLVLFYISLAFMPVFGPLVYATVITQELKWPEQWKFVSIFLVLFSIQMYAYLGG